MSLGGQKFMQTKSRENLGGLASQWVAPYSSGLMWGDVVGIMCVVTIMWVVIVSLDDTSQEDVSLEDVSLDFGLWFGLPAR